MPGKSVVLWIASRSACRGIESDPSLFLIATDSIAFARMLTTSNAWAWKADSGATPDSFLYAGRKSFV